ncbi:CAP domain-containing protein [Nitratifractor sp.]
MILTLFAYDTDGARLVNRIRTQAGMVPLRLDPRLSRAAYAHARYLGRTGSRGHIERRRGAFFFGRTPFDRFARARFPGRAGVENISYGERSYPESIRTLMGTVYHRLAFLDYRIDRIGTSAYGNRKGRIFVYDMASTAPAVPCTRPSPKNGRLLYGVCPDPSKGIDPAVFTRRLAAIASRSASVVVYPYGGMRGVPTRRVRETPDPLPWAYRSGYPVTVSLNPYIFTNIKLREFALFAPDGKRIAARVLGPGNRRMPPGSFALVPTRPLMRHTRYRVRFRASTSRGSVVRSWEFVTR